MVELLPYLVHTPPLYIIQNVSLYIERDIRHTHTHCRNSERAIIIIIMLKFLGRSKNSFRKKVPYDINFGCRDTSIDMPTNLEMLGQHLRKVNELFIFKKCFLDLPPIIISGSKSFSCGTTPKSLKVHH